MSRDHAPGRQLRLRIAHIAARLMAEDGIHDYSLAKRKAARQAGAAETRNLPSNEEVEAALHAYQQLYQADEQQMRLSHLRSCALDMMSALERFNPQLTGPVLDGSAGRYSSIDLHLFTDSPKDVELFMLNRGFEYRQRHRHIFRGSEPDTIMALSISTDDADFSISVFEHNDLRLSLRSTQHGRPFRHAGLDSVLAMQDQEQQDTGGG